MKKKKDYFHLAGGFIFTAGLCAMWLALLVYCMLFRTIDLAISYGFVFMAIASAVLVISFGLHFLTNRGKS
jgi:hypothetical protein